MDNEGVVDVDEESNFLVSAHGGEVNTLEFSCCTNVSFKPFTLTDALIVDVLYMYTVRNRISLYYTKVQEVLQWSYICSITMLRRDLT